MSKTFSYFAYGSNLLAQRIQINSPSAVLKGCGKLKNYRLDFITYSKRWKGASATIVPDESSDVWGAIWEIDIEHLPNLDKQEGVHQNIYFAFETDVETSDGFVIKCRTYQQVNIPPTLNGALPGDRQPSTTYLNTILLGASEIKLPEHYQAFLKNIPHNGYDGPANLCLLLDE